jgi:hypothetical protein
MGCLYCVFHSANLGLFSSSSLMLTMHGDTKTQVVFVVTVVRGSEPGVLGSGRPGGYDIFMHFVCGRDGVLQKVDATGAWLEDLRMLAGGSCQVSSTQSVEGIHCVMGPSWPMGHREEGPRVATCYSIGWRNWWRAKCFGAKNGSLCFLSFGKRSNFIVGWQQGGRVHPHHLYRRVRQLSFRYTLCFNIVRQPNL